jgi:hypothetical protein
VKQNKKKKQPEDRLLKKLSLKERSQQQKIRRLIAKDDSFKLI